MKKFGLVLVQARRVTYRVLDDSGDIDRTTRADAIYEQDSIYGNLIPLGGGDEIVADKVVAGVREAVEYVGGSVDWPCRVTD